MLQTERLILRDWKDSDREPFARMNADAEVMRYLGEPLSRTESDSLITRIELHFHDYGFGLYAAELRETGAFAGYVGLAVPRFDAPFMPAVEIGWRVAREYWNRGLATEGAHAVARHAFDEIGIQELVSLTVPQNTPSRRVMERLGMTHDEADDFDHPRLPVGHPLRRHVLYRLKSTKAPSE